MGSRAHAGVFVHMSAGECALLHRVDIYRCSVLTLGKWKGLSVEEGEASACCCD